MLSVKYMVMWWTISEVLPIFGENGHWPLNLGSVILLEI